MPRSPNEEFAIHGGAKRLDDEHAAVEEAKTRRVGCFFQCWRGWVEEVLAHFIGPEKAKKRAGEAAAAVYFRYSDHVWSLEYEPEDNDEDDDALFIGDATCEWAESEIDDWPDDWPERMGELI